jgi:hypothetical protein
MVDLRPESLLPAWSHAVVGLCVTFARLGVQRSGGDGHEREVNGVRVAPLPSVLRHHFWVGREEKRHGWQARERYAGAPSLVLALGDDHSPFNVRSAHYFITMGR